MSRYKPEWYEVVWTIGLDGKEKSKLFSPEQKDVAMKFYEGKVEDIKRNLFSNCAIYLTHTNRLYDLLHKAINSQNSGFISK